MDEVLTLEIGQAAPNFDCVDSKGNPHSLKQYMTEGKSVILYFYPKDSTSGCTTQACDFRDSMARLNKGNYVVLGVSKDSAKSHENFISKQDLNFPLLMDEDVSLHQAYGTWREKSMYGKTYMGTSRSTFVIGDDGLIKWAGYGVRTKGHVDKVIEELGIE
ncbi:MAG: peroxiredoxin [Candidatus Thermoplasmatota archaeon]|nr:peroxiredoxin [Candidatus Thermoplasmatota archaeon]MEC7255182.1 peroxiredoxin [Candidatus Thermoplasmatota archaeon]MEC8248976.1 peroxiredoxin [Candidatus Thermoplasmatota archaeon]MEC8312472.1 peroxiredoxin [Candidatus Thermoplasmatota archaeon]MEC8352965.1 peroxiredoxin [Candidatus Thermoplasmatota archaeon]